MHTMNYKLMAFIMTASLLGSGCSEEGVLQVPGDATPNSGVVSQKHFFIGIDPVSPTVYDLSDPAWDYSVEVSVTATIADRKDRLLTDSHTVNFATEWGILEQTSCVTVNGQCTVTWRPSSAFAPPPDLTSVIIAYTTGEEAFEDLNNNGTYDDGEAFYDVAEPWINTNYSTTDYTVTEDIIIDTVNIYDPYGNNLTHDVADSHFNGAGCTHSSECSTLTSTTVWYAINMDITGGTEAPAP